MMKKIEYRSYGVFRNDGKAFLNAGKAFQYDGKHKGRYVIRYDGKGRAENEHEKVHYCWRALTG